DYPRRDERGNEVDRQPGPAVAKAVPDRSKNILSFPEAGFGKLRLLALRADVVDDRVHREPANQAPEMIGHRRRDEVVALERLRGVLGFLLRMEPNAFGDHHL